MALVSYVLGDCPKCGGKNTYGNIDVRGDYVSLGCGACSFHGQLPLPPVQKRVLYLDQFFFSLAFRDNDSAFQSAAAQIRRLTERQLLLVPYSSLHEDETEFWHRRDELLDFIKHTARGHEFAPHYDIERVQIEHAFEVYLAGATPTHRVSRRDALDEEIDQWDGYYWIDVARQAKDRALLQSSKIEAIRALVALFPSWRAAQTTFEEDLAAELLDAGNTYLEAYLRFFRRVIEGDAMALIDRPIRSMVVEHLLHYLPAHLSIGERLVTIREFFSSEHFKRTPYNELSCRIIAMLRKLVKEGAYVEPTAAISKLSGFFYDVEHIATYAPYCDAIVVDRAMAEILNRATVGLANRHNVKVFSRGNWSEMMKWLDDIESTVSEEHTSALRLAYPGAAF